GAGVEGAVIQRHAVYDKQGRISEADGVDPPQPDRGGGPRQSAGRRYGQSGDTPLQGGDKVITMGLLYIIATDRLYGVAQLAGILPLPHGGNDHFSQGGLTQRQ